MEDKKINERESLTIITEMINRTKERYMPGDGKILLLWGYLTVVVAAIVWIALVKTNNPMANWLWFLIPIVGGIATPIVKRKMQICKGAKSYTDNISSRIWSIVWFSVVSSMVFCFGFLVVKSVNVWSMMLVLSLVIVPFALIMQGIVVNEKSIVWGGALGLVAGIFTVCCIAGDIMLIASWYMPVYIAAFVGMMIIPGHIINHKARKQQ